MIPGGNHPPIEVELLSYNNSTRHDTTDSLIVDSQFYFSCCCCCWCCFLSIAILLLLFFFYCFCCCLFCMPKQTKNDNTTNQTDNQSHTYLTQQVGRPNTSLRLQSIQFKPAAIQPVSKSSSLLADCLLYKQAAQPVIHSKLQTKLNWTELN